MQLRMESYFHCLNNNYLIALMVMETMDVMEVQYNESNILIQLGLMTDAMDYIIASGGLDTEKRFQF